MLCASIRQAHFPDIALEKRSHLIIRWNGIFFMLSGSLAEKHRVA